MSTTDTDRAETINPAETTSSVLRDAFSRVRASVDGLTKKMSPDSAFYRPDVDANSVAWLIWHLSRVQDSHIADAAGTEEVWTEGGWVDRFDLPFDRSATGYGQSSADVARVRPSATLLNGYHVAVDAATTRYLRGLTVPELQRVVDENWDPPVTVAARLVSVINDCTQHVGQASYVLGLAQRAVG